MALSREADIRATIRRSGVKFRMDEEKTLLRLYSESKRCLAGSPRQRHIMVKELVDWTYDVFTSSLRKSELPDGLVDAMDVSKVHPEALDMILALLEVVSSPSVDSFRERVAGRMTKVDELIVPMRLKDSEGRVISEDVRADARRIYRERAIAFGEILRKEGNLDRFYKSKAAKQASREAVQKLPEKKIERARTLRRL